MIADLSLVGWKCVKVILFYSPFLPDIGQQNLKNEMSLSPSQTEARFFISTFKRYFFFPFIHLCFILKLFWNFTMVTRLLLSVNVAAFFFFFFYGRGKLRKPKTSCAAGSGKMETRSKKNSSLIQAT